MKVLVGVLSVLGMAIVGCKKDGPPTGASASGGVVGGEVTCEQAVSKLKECGGDRVKDESKDELLAECSKQLAKRPDSLKPMAVCLDKPCAEFESCMEASGKAERAARRLTDIQAAKDTKDFKKVSYGCEMALEKKESPELVTACTDLAKTAVVEMAVELGKLRDEGKKDADYKCSSYQVFAKILSAEEEGKAKVLCDELNHARRVAEALEAIATAKTEADEKKLGLPFQCGHTESSLEKLNTEWAKRQIAVVAKACYVELGQVILSKKAETITYCDYNVKKILKGLKDHSLSDPAIDALLAGEKLKAACKDELAGAPPVVPTPAADPAPAAVPAPAPAPVP